MAVSASWAPPIKLYAGFHTRLFRLDIDISPLAHMRDFHRAWPYRSGLYEASMAAMAQMHHALHFVAT
ncbi:hypothetical protein DIE22_30415 [Burkholderia sp. Bp9142]|nr:hypothetical protein DIE22_30415 [Burkholderia sp. Bp9142]